RRVVVLPSEDGMRRQSSFYILCPNTLPFAPALYALSGRRLRSADIPVCRIAVRPSLHHVVGDKEQRRQATTKWGRALLSPARRGCHVRSGFSTGLRRDNASDARPTLLENRHEMQSHGRPA